MGINRRKRRPCTRSLRLVRVGPCFLPDLKASLRDPAGHPIYCRMCELELSSGFSFQSKWLSRLALHLIPDGEKRLDAAMLLAARRKAAEAWLPKHLAFTKGWPHAVPTATECEQLATMRRTVCDLYGWQTNLSEPDSIRHRYQILWDLKQAA